ncbi:MAG: ubiquinol-cytochrome C chaperone family protein [Pseudomonadota bacterium]
MLRFFTKNEPNPAVQALYDKAVAQARLPIFYQTFGVPDTLEGRFDMVVFHVWPLIDTLRTEDGAISGDGQALFDAFVYDMEQNLRSIGVSDTTFPKKMKAIGKAFYGRFDAYRTATGDPAALAVVAARNILGDEGRCGTAEARALGAYGQAMREAAAGADVTDLMAAFRYPHPAPFTPGAGAPTSAAQT